MPRKPRFKLPPASDVVIDAHTVGLVAGTKERRIASSTVQPRIVSDTPLSSGNGPQQTRQNVRPLCPPRSEARTPKSARVVVPQVPAAREHSRSRADLDETDSEDENYSPATDEDELLEEELDNLSEREEVGRRGKETRRKDRDIWKVHIIENGVEIPKNLTANQLFSLPPGQQVVLPFNGSTQPIGDAAGLLSTVLGSLGSDFTLFPIGVRSWKHMKDIREREYNRQIKRFFFFEDDTRDSRKTVIMTKLGKIWRDTRGNLFNKFYDETKSVAENVAHHCPDEIDKDDWQAFLEYRLEEDTQEKCRKNAANRAKQTYTHVGGSKSLARRTEEEEIRHGRHFSRGEMWTMVHKRKDGSYIHDDARAIGEAIAEIESRDESVKELSQHDSLAQVFGKEHPGRVRGVGPGPCPTKLFGSTSKQSSYGAQIGAQIEEYQKEIIELKAEAAEEKKKRQTMETVLRFLIQRQGDDLPPEIASEMNALGSGPTTSHTMPSEDNPDLLSPP